MSEAVSNELPFFTLGEAAKQAGVSKPTLSKAIKTGRISAEKQPDGSYRIQPVELFRVYPPETHRNGLDRSEFVERETGSENRLVAEQVAVLRERLALLTEGPSRDWGCAGGRVCPRPFSDRGWMRGLGFEAGGHQRRR